jgi:hypothetical protein
MTVKRVGGVLALVSVLALSCDRAGIVEPTVQEPPVPAQVLSSAHDETHSLPSSEGRKYTRPAWLDTDRDCQTTRSEVLIAESSGPVEFEDESHCKVVRGNWRCPYTGALFHDPRELDIDHVVPLKNAWESGASAWTDERWRRYANSLENPEDLVAVAASANRAKGARGPDQWLPSLAESRCTYVRAWTAIKARWELSAGANEASAIGRALRLCDAGQTPPLPQTIKAENQPPASPTPEEPLETCCKVCRKGKACGNTCIARDKTCTVGPGCACDG